MSTTLNTFLRSRNPVDPGDSDSKKDLGFVVENTDVGFDSDLASDINPGELTFDEDTAGGMGRHLGVFSCTMLIVGSIIGTGIFSTPSSILGSVGSVGASLMLWVAGLLLSFCGLFVWLEFGTMFPRSGGEKVYLEAVYRRPKHLATVVFAANAIILNFSSSNCIVKHLTSPKSILLSAGRTADLWAVRGIAIGVIVFTVSLHGFAPRLGVYVLTLFKIIILLFIVVTGWVVLSGKTSVEDPHANFRHAFAGSSNNSNDYATAMFKVLFSYAGWQDANYVLNEVKDPVRTIKIAGPLGLGITSALYIFANIAYFAASSKADILKSGTTVASLFFGNVFGTNAQKALTVFVALRYVLGAAVLTCADMPSQAYSAARVNQELAKEGIPLPFGNRIWASNWPTQNAPFPGLIVHLISTVIVIIAPPPQVAYPFILDVSGYPEQIIDLFVILGLFYLRWAKPRLPRPFKGTFALNSSRYINPMANTKLRMLVAPFIRPPDGIGDTPPLPYYLYCLIGIAVMVVGMLYWAVWKLAFPYIFGFCLVPRKETLPDGTVVTLASLLFL
ncbi:amino acid transporter [Multifurca ochricompacta]|uniref:Amino acid transporter n=1 Tax=Multifurca ochricompacta TaxID=376703 RepID=A0AAD4LY20_9AGAM|nr:amino acid transporter [Multifurca ochricompacta]